MRGVLSQNYLKYNAYYYNLINPKEGETILDLGCGVGDFVDYANKRGSDSYGVDFSKSVIDVAKKNYKGNFIVAPVTNLPFKDNYFDKIFCNEVFEHLSIEEGKKMIDEMYRVLKSNGSFLIKTPNRLSNYGFRILQTINGLIKKGKLKFKTDHDWTHIHEYTKSEAVKLFSNFKFICYEHTYIPNNSLLTKLFNLPIIRKILGVKLIISGKKK